MGGGAPKGCSPAAEGKMVGRALVVLVVLLLLNVNAEKKLPSFGLDVAAGLEVDGGGGVDVDD